MGPPFASMVDKRRDKEAQAGPKRPKIRLKSGSLSSEGSVSVVLSARLFEPRIATELCGGEDKK
jgi:hypothetical protein